MASNWSRRKTLQLAGSALVTGLAGCTTGSSGDSSPTTSQSPPPSNTYTVEVISYQDLSPASRQTFRQLVDNGSIQGVCSEFPNEFWEAPAIRYQNILYAVEKEQTGRFIAEYSLETERIKESSIENESEVIAFEDLTQEARDVFESAPTRPTQERLPKQLYEHRYARYEDDHYELIIIHGDLIECELTVESRSS